MSLTISLTALSPVEAASPPCIGEMGYSASFGDRRTFLLRPDRMESIRTRWAHDPDLAPARDRLMSRASAAMLSAPYTVVDKTRAPASGDRHDYLSIGPYWWPDPSRPDGLPYVRRDGEVNPERSTDAFDATDMDGMSLDVEALALAYYFTGDDAYANKAGELIRTWFLAPETRMNPNLTHAQAVPGRETGRAEGVIDAHRLTRVVEALGLLEPSSALTGPEREAMRDWFDALVTWMATSPNGLAEKAAGNNHGVFFDRLISHFALFAGRTDLARTVIEGFGRDRLVRQIEPDGRLPRELARTRSLHYSTWTLTAAFDVADLARCVGVDVLDPETEGGQALRSATSFVAAWAGREQEWPWPERNLDETEGLYEVLLRGAWAWSDADLGAKASLYHERNALSDLNLTVPAYAP